MKKIKSQSGRSMVEMLGVLAIIGVLSVGGIAGYSLSMRRHRANGVADLASKYALVVYGICQQKLMNGEIDGSVNNSGIISGDGCDGEYTTIPFADAGVGNKPAGVRYFNKPYVMKDASGNDIVVASVEFDDDKLCQAVGSISGTGCIHYSNYPSTVEFKIKQN